MLDGFVERGFSTSSFRFRGTDVLRSWFVGHAHLDDDIVILLPLLGCLQPIAELCGGFNARGSVSA